MLVLKIIMMGHFFPKFWHSWGKWHSFCVIVFKLHIHLITKVHCSDVGDSSPIIRLLIVDFKNPLQ